LIGGWRFEHSCRSSGERRLAACSGSRRRRESSEKNTVFIIPGLKLLFGFILLNPSTRGVPTAVTRHRFFDAATLRFVSPVASAAAAAAAAADRVRWLSLMRSCCVLAFHRGAITLELPSFDPLSTKSFATPPPPPLPPACLPSSPPSTASTTTSACRAQRVHAAHADAAACGVLLTLTLVCKVTSGLTGTVCAAVAKHCLLPCLAPFNLCARAFTIPNFPHPFRQATTACSTGASAAAATPMPQASASPTKR